MKTPVKVGIWAMTANMVFNLMLIWHLEHVGLALATALSSWLNAYWLLKGLKRDGVYTKHDGWLVFLLRILVANIIMLLVISYGLDATEIWFDWSVWARAAEMGKLVVIGMLVYFITLMATGMNLKSIIRHKVS